MPDTDNDNYILWEAWADVAVWAGFDPFSSEEDTRLGGGKIVIPRDALQDFKKELNLSIPAIQEYNDKLECEGTTFLSRLL